MAVIEINTIQDLIAFSEGDYGRGTAQEYLDVVLTADLDFADLTEQDVPYNWNGCTGTWYVNFDGQGHKIDNIYYMDSASWGVFNTLYGSIQNLKLTNIYVTSTANEIAGLVLYPKSSALIKNCHISGHIETLSNNNSSPANGLYFQTQTPTIRECSISGTIKGLGSANGIGQNTSGATVMNCTIHADIIGTKLNVSALTSQYATVTNCILIGKIYAGSNSYVGGYSSTLHNCILVYKAGSSTNFRYNSTFNNCYYDSTVAATAGFSLTSPTAATTEQLKSEQWLRNHDFTI